MSNSNAKAHWENVYNTKSESEVSWFQESPAPSLELIDLTEASSQSKIVDIGGGASRLVDSLVLRGFKNITVLDLSEAALANAKERLGVASAGVQWVTADVIKWYPAQTYDVWHDRAAFHFFTDGADKAAYVERLNKAVKLGGCAIIGTFALDGPERCSGLPVNRYNSASLASTLGASFELINSRPHDHATPWGAVQHFQFSTFRRKA